MRARVRKFAHVLERLGLAMAGASSGLFVAALVGSSFAQLTSQAFLLIMMLVGAIGFYLGIDTPPLLFHHANDSPSNHTTARGVDAAEFMSAVGTFLATFSAFASVSVIVVRYDPHLAWTAMVMVGWVLGVAMQIVAGTIARTRR
jgi:hypothetical protein